MNALALIPAGIVPKPTKSDVRRAMARAIREQQIEARKVESEKIDAERAVLTKRALKILRKRGKWDGAVESWRDQLSTTVTIGRDDPEALELLTLLRECNRRSLPMVEDEADIIRNLIEAERDANRSPVDRLLSDPTIKKKLIKLGNDLLNGSEKSDGAVVEISAGGAK